MLKDFNVENFILWFSIFEKRVEVIDIVAIGEQDSWFEHTGPVGWEKEMLSADKKTLDHAYHLLPSDAQVTKQSKHQKSTLNLN